MRGLPLACYSYSQCAPGGPGLLPWAPLFIFPPQCGSLLCSKGLWSVLPLLQLTLLVLILSLSLTVPWGELRNSLLPDSSWVLVSGHTGQQKIPSFDRKAKAELRGPSESKNCQDGQRVCSGRMWPFSLHSTVGMINKLD